MFDRRRAISLTGTAACLLLACTDTLPTPFNRASSNGNGVAIKASQITLAALPDGDYQLCTEPEPQDWRDGAGVCLNVMKQNLSASGYYGYPHSSSFICLRGEILEEVLSGEALFVSWPAHEWVDIPQGEFSWDEEGRLLLNQVRRIPGEETTEGGINWIFFQQANLNIQGLYDYSSPRMKSPSLLCDWSILSTP